MHNLGTLGAKANVLLLSVAQPDQARIVALNARLFLKKGGGMLISIKANCIDSTAPPEQVFAQEVEKLRQEKFFPKEQLTLEPYERDHAVRHALHSLFPDTGGFLSLVNITHVDESY